MHINESTENYLETILILQKKTTRVRSIDIANELGYTKASVSRALKLLRENGYALVDKDGYILLTASGLKIAETIYERHVLLAKHLISLGVDEDLALKDACKIEHVISSDAFDKIREHLLKHS